MLMLFGRPMPMALSYYKAVHGEGVGRYEELP